MPHLTEILLIAVALGVPLALAESIGELIARLNARTSREAE